MYQVPEHIDKNKIFIAQRSEIDGRLDPHYNKPEFCQLFDKLENLSYKLSTLRQESYSIFSGITPKSGGDAYNSEPDSIPFVRSGDFSETNQIDFDSLLHIKPEIHKGIMASSQLRINDLLIAIVGATIGKIGIYRYDREANINQAICGVRLKEHINPFYVQAFYQTETGQKIIERIKRPVARANLNLDEIGNLPIPMVNECVQENVVAKLQEGINLRLQKESEAQRILNSIDTYFLEELGITLPETRTDLGSRIFTVKRSELEDRLDPKFNKDFTFLKNLNSMFPWTTLGDVVLNNGQYGANESAKDYKKGDIRYIRITDIDELGNLKSTDKKTADTIDKTYYLQYNDLLFARSGSVGRCYIHKNVSEQAIYAGYLIRFLANTDLINPDYLFFYCNSELYKYWVNTIQRPAVQANINAQEYCKMPIPFPPLYKQKEMSSHIYSLRQQAKALQSEGKAILENAKREVEKMIIGE